MTYEKYDEMYCEFIFSSFQLSAMQKHTGMIIRHVS